MFPLNVYVTFNIEFKTLMHNLMSFTKKQEVLIKMTFSLNQYSSCAGVLIWFNLKAIMLYWRGLAGSRLYYHGHLMSLCVFVVVDFWHGR